MKPWLPLVLLPFTDVETRVVEYLKAHVRPGQPVVVSDLYNSVFKAPEERAVLDRLFNSFFKIPLFAAQFDRGVGRPPSLAEISEQFAFAVPGEADLMLRIMEADPRVPRFLVRDPATGEITKVDADAILAHPRFGKLLERTIAGWEGRPAPAFATETYDGKPFGAAEVGGRPHLLYFWFTNCPPCLETSPLLAELERAYSPRGFLIVGANADRVLGLRVTDQERAEYGRGAGLRFPLVHVSPAMQETYGSVSVFPTFFFVDRKGTVVKHFVSSQQKPALEAATRAALE